MKWRPFTYRGTTYDLSHLDPFQWRYTTTTNEKRPGCAYTFQVTFNMHCFTREPLSGERASKDLWYKGPKEKRIFCFERYELSHRLPAIIRGLQDRECYCIPHSNFFVIDPFYGAGGRSMEYEVYFRVPRANGAGREKGRLRLIVQSAYRRTRDYETTQPKKILIALDEIAHGKLRGEKIDCGGE
uniref:Uncharacterized protein n=1 Tax=Candidatus Kentrum sp. DK TaxID=2126562 RepID=A0A450TMW5_9GAMM|nr:MAG: hypothetical protein BECKDK2373B_GA0170837_12322 [Candidatus Kentron sp. DK]